MDKDTFLLMLGNHIIKLRSERNWSQSDLARASEMERHNIYRLENGKINPSIFYLKQIADALEISLPELVNF